MSLSWPAKQELIVVGLDEYFNFMNYADPENPTTLRLPVREASTVTFCFTPGLMAAGWSFQDVPFRVKDDYGVNFSSFAWVEMEHNGKTLQKSASFKVVFQCERLGLYEYSIFMLDNHGQKITLDPVIENGAGYGG